MQPDKTQHKGMNDIAAVVFLGAIALTAALIWLGIGNHPWPKWLLALTTFL
jgi:hypothetical protein